MPVTTSADSCSAIMLSTAAITVHHDAGIVEIVTPGPASPHGVSDSDWLAVCKLLKRLDAHIESEPLYQESTDTDLWTATF